ncbi:hypothetical protein ACHAW6_003827 [Cyclotella cf. meneghiniana]
MKVFLRYEENDDESTHKTLKITLPKSWKTGPTSRLLDQFIESYNAGKEGEANPLNATAMHLCVRRRVATNGSINGDAAILKDLPSDGIVVEFISDRDDVYVCHGPSRTNSEIKAEREEQLKREKEDKKNQSQCVHFGCNKRFPKGGPYPECHFHSGPPVFHETAKFWSCCPDKKAYDWESFQTLPTCQTGICTDVREESDAPRKEFLGGCDLREQISAGPKLRSIDDFNASVAAGGSESAPVAVRLRSVLKELGVENELFDQVFDGIKKEIREKNVNGTEGDDAKVVDEAVKVLGAMLKSAMKSIAVEQLRIR